MSFKWICAVGVGDIVYVIYRKKPWPVKVVFIGMGEDKEYFFNVRSGRSVKHDNWWMHQFTEKDIGRIVFLTKEAAQNVIDKYSGGANGQTKECGAHTEDATAADR